MELEKRLRAAEPLKPRKPDRVHNIDLTGEMSKYIWSINGVAWNPQGRRCRSPRANGWRWS